MRLLHPSLTFRFQLHEALILILDTTTHLGMFTNSVVAESLRQKSLATRMLHPPKVTQDPYGAVAPPLYQTATFDQVSAVQCGPYDYTRSEDPTRDQLEAQIADLEV